MFRLAGLVHGLWTLRYEMWAKLELRCVFKEIRNDDVVADESW